LKVEGKRGDGSGNCGGGKRKWRWKWEGNCKYENGKGMNGKKKWK
jgi:hypothetical protein